VVNLRIGWTCKAVEFYGFAYNLFDQHYQTSASARPTDRVGQGQILGLGSMIRY
jgi:outer membrane receptor protein involved in Fe transport